MAVDIVGVCAAADENSSSQSLAIVMSVLFSIYTVIAIALSALTIWSTSQMARIPSGTRAAATATAAYASDGADLSLVALTHARR